MTTTKILRATAIVAWEQAGQHGLLVHAVGPRFSDHPPEYENG